MTTNYQNEDGTPTQAFFRAWRDDKNSLTAAGLFLGKEEGRWVVKKGVRETRYKVQYNGVDVNPGASWEKEGILLGSKSAAEQRVTELLAPRHVATFPGSESFSRSRKPYAPVVAKSAEELEAKLKSEASERLQNMAKREVRASRYEAAGLQVVEVVSYRRPQFGTDAERAAFKSAMRDKSNFEDLSYEELISFDGGLKDAVQNSETVAEERPFMREVNKELGL